MFGAGDGMIIHADLGNAPWDMLHNGIAERTGISVGTVIVIVGFLILLCWIPLRQRPGVGTVMNAIEIGVAVDVVTPLLPDSSALAVRVPLLVIGLLLVAVGSGVYIGAGLGTGPRDGLMVGIAARGVSIRVARTTVEATVLVAGLLLGQRPGVGTLAFVVLIGPMVHAALPRLAMRQRPAPA
jgi:uncharacterized membrane protein YczE